MTVARFTGLLYPNDYISVTTRSVYTHTVLYVYVSKCGSMWGSYISYRCTTRSAVTNLPYSRKYWQELNLAVAWAPNHCCKNIKFDGSVKDRHTYMQV